MTILDLDILLSTIDLSITPHSGFEFTSDGAWCSGRFIEIPEQKISYPPYKNLKFQDCVNVLHVSSHHPKLEKIKFKFVDDAASSVAAIAIITEKSGRTRFFILGKALAKLYMEHLNTLHDSKDGDDFLERYNNKNYSLKDDILPLTYWGQWMSAPNDKIFYASLDKIFLTELKKIIPNMLSENPNKTLKILDIGAGAGRLAKKILETFNNVNIHYIFLEPSEAMQASAQQILCKNYGKQVTFVNKNLQDYNDKSLQADIVISSGGPLNEQVVSREVAFENVNKIQELMASDGMLLASGYTGLNVKASTFENNGFTVLSFNKALLLNNDLLTWPFYTCKNQLPELTFVQDSGLYFNALKKNLLLFGFPATAAHDFSDETLTVYSTRNA